MNESKGWLLAKELHPDTNVVTHADYKALEDEVNALRNELAVANEQHWKTLAELAECRKDVERLSTALQWIVDRPSTVSEQIARNALDGNEYPPKRKAIARSKA
jgi:septal ring factor EnvC (AmiA/AmiB activator)